VLHRNIELKATDPHPERSLAVCLELGAEDRGVIAQRDTYFRVPAGRLKLREETPGGAHLIQYVRADGGSARESRYRIAPVEDGEALRAALDAALGTLVVVDKERRLLLWKGVRIHLDRVNGLGSFVELEGVEQADAQRVDELRAALEIGAERVVAESYADRRMGAETLIAAARTAMERAYAPYSRFQVGAALRAPDGSIHAGANVENAAYPQGQCAEASAIGALVAAGARRITEVAVIGTGEEPCTPCGGCRQRLNELAAPDTAIHLCAAEGGARRTVTLRELLPYAFGPASLA
jgi:homotetrameric cytidine deaminase